MPADPLTTLLLDADELDRARLANALTEIIGVDMKSGRVVLKPGFTRLDTRRKIVSYLLGIKVAVLLQKLDQEQIAPKFLISATGIPAGSVHPALKDLREQRMLSAVDGEYFIAPHQVNICLALIEGAG